MIWAATFLGLAALVYALHRASPPAFTPAAPTAREVIERAVQDGRSFRFFVPAGAEWQAPRYLIEKLRREHVAGFMIQCDSAFHSKMRFELDDDGFTARLSFDGLYTCTFPWSSIRDAESYVADSRADAPAPSAPPPKAPRKRNSKLPDGWKLIDGGPDADR